MQGQWETHFQMIKTNLCVHSCLAELQQLSTASPVAFIGFDTTCVMRSEISKLLLQKNGSSCHFAVFESC